MRLLSIVATIAARVAPVTRGSGLSVAASGNHELLIGGGLRNQQSVEHAEPAHHALWIAHIAGTFRRHV